MSSQSASCSAKSVLIIGCGIGGPVLAMALQRQGIHSAIYEAHDRPADYVGSFLNLASNGLSALHAIRVSVHSGFPTEQMVMWSGSGKRLGMIPNGMKLGNGLGSVTMRRGQLHRELREEAIRRGIRIHVGKKLQGVSLLNGLATATFADGSSAQAQLLVGADGLHSQTRQLIDPSSTKPRDLKQLSIGGIAPTTFVPATENAYHMVFGKRGFFGYSVRPSGEAFWFANIATFEGAVSLTVPEWKHKLSRLFADDVGSPAQQLISETKDELAAYPLFDMPVVKHWHRDHMVLLGDAAHATSPSSGQGAAMAIEDAVTLAKCLVAPIPVALLEYERLRRPRTERVVRYSARISNSKVAGPIRAKLRDMMMPHALKWLAKQPQQAWLYEHMV